LDRTNDQPIRPLQTLIDEELPIQNSGAPILILIDKREVDKPFGFVPLICGANPNGF
jgi:hypothetical protein